MNNEPEIRFSVRGLLKVVAIIIALADYWLLLFLIGLTLHHLYYLIPAVIGCLVGAMFVGSAIMHDED